MFSRNWRWARRLQAPDQEHLPTTMGNGIGRPSAEIEPLQNQDHDSNWISKYIQFNF